MFNAQDLVISKKVLNSIGMSADEMRLELAVRLYTSHRLPLDKAASLAELNQTDFQEELAKRGHAREQ